MRFRMSILFMIVAALAFGCDPSDPRLGCVSSKFQVASDSRIPKWLTIPSGYTRADVTVEIYESRPCITKYDVKAILKGPPPEYAVLSKKIGVKRPHPISEAQGYHIYPNFMIINVEGVEEVVEHKRMEPIVYVSDDPKITSVLKQPKASK